MVSDRKHGDYFCSHCGKISETPLHKMPNGEECDYNAFWIDSPLKAENAELKARITELENALNEAADDIKKQKVVGEGRRIHYSNKYRAIAKGDK